MKYIIYTVMDALDTTDFENTLVAMKIMSMDHRNIAAIKEELESAKKAKSKLENKLKKFEESRKIL